MNTRHKTIRASRFVLSTLKPMHRIAMDTIGPLDIAKQFQYILVIIDTFTRYVELYPTKDVSADDATDALWCHSCRFGMPLEIMTDYGTQFIEQDLGRICNSQGFDTIAAYHIRKRNRHSRASEKGSEPT